MRPSRTAVSLLTFAAVGAACLGGAVWAVNLIETRSRSNVDRALLRNGEDWAEVRADGLQLILTGTAQSEAARFRALTAAGSVVDSSRLIDQMQVAAPEPIEPPRFSVELLRNAEGISLIGLVPEPGDARDLASVIAERAAGAEITDMLETTDHPAPATWSAAVAFGLEALDRLPRSKISISADRVAVTAIGDSAAQKRRLEAELARLAPDGIALALDISAPRPVITPFTLRFVIEDGRARFDACSADNEDGRARILSAAVAAGAEGQISCRLGLGVPSPTWSEAAATAIGALGTLGAGTVTFSDADVSLIAPHTVPRAAFDRIAGDLEAQLPPVFSLDATRQEPPETRPEDEGPSEFTATLSPDGQVQLRGGMSDPLTREAVDSFARARFGADAVYSATRVDESLPDGWPVRALAALEALSLLHDGTMRMQVDLVEVQGMAGNPQASDEISRILSEKLGQGQEFRIDVAYDEALDPLAGLPTPRECVDGINEILTANQVSFAPGSADIEDAAGDTLDAVAEMMRQCPDAPMEIGGHTDSQGRASMNLDLSQRRADAVLAALMERRVLVGSLTAKGYGAEQPIADNDTAEGREANRRIEFRLLLPDPPEDVSTAAAGAADGAAADTAGPEATEDDGDADGAANETANGGAQADGTMDGDGAAGGEVTAQPADDDTPRPRARPNEG